METKPQEIRRAPDYQTIAPLLELCKSGRLFEVQQWIAAGKPVNPPLSPKGKCYLGPLDIAIERGFHSLLQVLLEGGAAQERIDWDHPMDRALRARRFDLVQLLVDHGFDPKTVDMNEVFATWDRNIVEYFIGRGADIQNGHPFASAFCERIRTALGVYMQCRQGNPELREQVNIALRHHCREGNMKWVSLMLWAGADPCKPGTHTPGQPLDEDEEGLSALGYAALHEHYKIFSLRPIRFLAIGPWAVSILPYLTTGDGLEVLERLLQKGADPNDLENGGCSALRSCLVGMGWDARMSYCSWEREGMKLDTTKAREKLRAIGLLAEHGAKWVPEDTREIDSARRSLLMLVPDYAAQFVSTMAKYRACTLECVQMLLRTSTIQAHTAAHKAQFREVLAAWGEGGAAPKRKP